MDAEEKEQYNENQRNYEKDKYNNILKNKKTIKIKQLIPKKLLDKQI